MESFDTGKLIADIISANAENLFEASKHFFIDKSNQIKARLSSTFIKYLEGIERKYSSTKTIIYRDTPQLIKEFYEPIDLYNDKLVLENPNISSLLGLKKPIIITGTGGSGKSTFLKYLLLNSLESKKFVPVFVELRNVEQEQTTIIDFIYASLQLHKVKLDSEYLDQAFAKGNFLFLLDGFDELSSPFAQKISTEIDNMSQIYPKCNFIVTSRPGQEFTSWSNFIELHTKPLTLDKAVNLIQRLNFDIEIKDNFIKELRKSLYDSHRSFFENPLLISIMLITFRDSASIPSELHNFYSLAFEALYYRHDASKTFKRPTLTNLPVNKGKEIMAAFSLITYLNNQTSFSNHELKDNLTKAMKLTDCECDIEDLVTDLLRAFCMLLQDGTTYQYTHRSFQEYFAACYLVSANELNQIQLITQFSRKADSDITLELAYGMNPKLIEEKLIIPFLKKYKESIGFKNKLTKPVFVKFSKKYFSSVSILDGCPALTLGHIEASNGDENLISEKSSNLRIVRFILKLYNVKRKYIKPKKNDSVNSLLPTLKTKREISLVQAFKYPNLVNWFFTHSLESYVVNQLMLLEKNLRDKSEKNSLLFDSLLKKN